MITVEQLITPTTFEEELDDILEFWQALGLETTAWQAGDPERAYAELWAEMSTRLLNTLPSATISNFYVEHATGIALTFIADSLFDVQRIAAVATQVDVTFTDTTGGGPHTIDDSILLNDTVNGLTFTVVGSDTLPMSGSVTVTAECLTPGSVGNVANATITELQTPIAGVTVTNGTAGGDSAITRLGVNSEKDPTLRQRCRTKFATFSPNSPISAYENLVLGALDGSGNPVGITKVWIDASNPGGPGTVYIYIANQTATATGTQVTDVQAYIDDDRVSPASIPTVIAATELPIDIYASLVCEAGFGDSAKDAVETAFTEYIEGTSDPDDDNIGLPLGGKQIDSTPGGTGFVLFDDLIALAKAVPGVVTVTISDPNGNKPVEGNELATVNTILISVVER